MSGWFPRLSPDGKHVASGDTTITVDGVLVSKDGGGPVWADNVTVYFGRHSDGALMRWTPSAGVVLVAEKGGNGVAAAGHQWCIWRTDPPRLIFFDGQELAGFTDPAYSDSGAAFAACAHADESLWLGGRQIDYRPCLNPRFGSETLCWETGATIWGRSTPGQPNTPLTVPGLHQYKPVPVWTGRDLVVLSHTDTGVILQQWGSVQGWHVYDGLTDGPHDARAIDPTHVRCVWSVRGVPDERTIDLDSATIDLTPPPPPPPPPPAPLPDVPFTPIAGAVVEDLLPRFLAQCTAQSGDVLWFRKSAPPDWGAWHDFDDHNIGLLADSSTGKMLPDGRIDSMYFGRDHLWFPRRAVNGWTAEYDTTFIWLDGAHIPAHVKLQVYVGRGRYQGEVVDVQHVYDNRSVDPKNPKRKAGYLEIDYLGPSGFTRWEAWQDDQNGVPQLVQWTQPYPIAAKGAFVEPPRPKPYDTIITVAQPPEKPPVSIPVQQIVDGLGQLPWNLDVEALRQFAAGVWKRDRLGEDVVTGGALAYFHRYVFAAIAEQFVHLGRLPDASDPAKDAAEWRAGFTVGVQRALAAYRREIPPDPEDVPNPQ